MQLSMFVIGVFATRFAIDINILYVKEKSLIWISISLNGIQYFGACVFYSNATNMWYVDSNSEDVCAWCAFVVCLQISIKIHWPKQKRENELKKIDPVIKYSDVSNGISWNVLSFNSIEYYYYLQNAKRFPIHFASLEWAWFWICSDFETVAKWRERERETSRKSHGIHFSIHHPNMYVCFVYQHFTTV